MNKKRIVFIIALLIVVPVLLTACIPGHERYLDNPAGFIWGFWHGLIAWLSFVIQIFTGGDFTIFEANNSGWPYSLGFLLGMGGFGGGVGGGIVRVSLRRGKGIRISTRDRDED